MPGRHLTRDREASVERRRRALESFEGVMELPLLLLAVAMVPLLVVPLLVDLRLSVEDALVALEWLVWAAFAFEYLVRLVLTRPGGALCDASGQTCSSWCFRSCALSGWCARREPCACSASAGWSKSSARPIYRAGAS